MPCGPLTKGQKINPENVRSFNGLKNSVGGTPNLEGSALKDSG